MFYFYIGLHLVDYSFYNVTSLLFAAASVLFAAASVLFEDVFDFFLLALHRAKYRLANRATPLSRD